MGLLDSLGVGDIESGINFTTLGYGALAILGMVVVLVVTGIITFAYYSKKIKKSQFKNLIIIYTEINGKLTRIGQDYAKELFIPDTNISLYFLKGKKIYIARPTRAMGKDEYWYKILENGEWVNFNLSVDPDSDVLALANYDHRDTRYAYVNLKEIIKRNYTDKSKPWWKDPVIMNIISFAIMAVIFILGVWFITMQLKDAIAAMGPVAQQLKVAADAVARSAQLLQNINSGVA